MTGADRSTRLEALNLDLALRRSQALVVVHLCGPILDSTAHPNHFEGAGKGALKIVIYVS